jgi:hypothetical protein
VKSQGKSIQYHGQIDRDRGHELYGLFVDSIRAGIILEAAHHHDDDGSSNRQELPPGFLAWKTQRDKQLMMPVPTTTTATALLDPAVSETQVFRSDPIYGSFDNATGFPLTLANGQFVSKSAAKKLRKIYDAHAQKHLKYTMRIQPSSPSPPGLCVVAATRTATPVVDDDVAPQQQQHQPQWSVWMESCRTKCQVVTGSFGKRQGLELVSDMGPFCHVLTL